IFYAVRFFFFSSRRRHTRSTRDWSSDVCSSDLNGWDKTPPVTLNVRHPGEKFVLRHEHEWPLARTQWTKFYLDPATRALTGAPRSEEHTSELQSRVDLVCRLLLEKKTNETQQTG